MLKLFQAGSPSGGSGGECKASPEPRTYWSKTKKGGFSIPESLTTAR